MLKEDTEQLTSSWPKPVDRKGSPPGPTQRESWRPRWTTPLGSQEEPGGHHLLWGQRLG